MLDLELQGHGRHGSQQVFGCAACAGPWKNHGTGYIAACSLASALPIDWSSTLKQLEAHIAVLGPGTADPRCVYLIRVRLDALLFFKNRMLGAPKVHDRPSTWVLEESVKHDLKNTRTISTTLGNPTRTRDHIRLISGLSTTTPRALYILLIT